MKSPLRHGHGLTGTHGGDGSRCSFLMHKACEGGVTLSGGNQVVSEILEQAGFDSILHVSGCC